MTLLSHVVVVGGTGILEPAVRELLVRGAAVSVVSRSGRALPGAWPVAADVQRPARLGTALDVAVVERGPVTLALAYQPFADEQGWRTLAARTRGPLIALLTSAHAAPGAPDPVLPEGTAEIRRLLLGWHGRGPSARWHTPEEISAAALAVADGELAEPAVLGNVRPWDERP